jgi:hypothetical protein
MNTEHAKKLITLALQTRRFGHCYVPADIRNNVWGWRGVTHGDIKLSFRGFGRSLQSGGHKYKVHARYVANDMPVPSKVLAAL